MLVPLILAFSYKTTNKV